MESHSKAIDGRAGSPVLLRATLAYAALSGIALAGVGTLPAASESGAQLVDWFREHGNSVRWFMWGLNRSHAAACGYDGANAAIASGAASRRIPVRSDCIHVYHPSVDLDVGRGLSLHADTLEPATARAIFDAADFFGPVFTGVTTTMIGPVTLLALRRQAGPPLLLGVLGLVAFVEQTIETITIFGSAGFTQPGGPMNMQLGAGLTLAWLLTFGLWGGLRGHPQNSGA